MQFAAIVERRLTHWYIYLPALATGQTVPEPNDVHATAVALAARATSVEPHEVQVSLHLAAAAKDLVTTPSIDVEVRHTDGAWSTAQQTGWVRSRDGSWKSLVRYVAHGATWERTVHASCVRETKPSLAVPRPRTGDEVLDVDRGATTGESTTSPA